MRLVIPLDNWCTKLLEILGKVEELTDIIFHLQHFLDIIVKTLGKPPQLTWMDNIKKDDDLYAVLFPKSDGQYAYSDCSPDDQS